MNKRSTVFRDLVYDVGMNSGADTGFFLHRGYRVIAVEANPQLAEAGRMRFASEIESGRLSILNVGIAEQAGTATFWICDDNSEWSSFDRRIPSRDGSRHHPVEVKTVPLSEILEQWGVPGYLKIEIDGAERLCLHCLAGGPLPQFISLTTENLGDDQDPSEEETASTLHALHQVGYRKFKLISMVDLSAAGRDVAPFVKRLVRSAAYGRLRVLGLSHLAKLLTRRGRLSREYGYDLRPSATGPWGEETPGPWLSLESAERLLREVRCRHFRKRVPKYSFWYNWHATF